MAKAKKSITKSQAKALFATIDGVEEKREAIEVEYQAALGALHEAIGNQEFRRDGKRFMVIKRKEKERDDEGNVVKDAEGNAVIASYQYFFRSPQESEILDF